jgi:putative membrane protein
MFIDYITLMLVNMAAGLVILAWFFLKGLGGPNEKAWASGLAMVGLVALVAGFAMTFTWPIPKLEQVNLAWANVAFGETTVLLGILFLGAALAVSRSWSLVPVTVYACLAGVIGIVIGVRIAVLGLSQMPPMTAVGFILTGLGGPLSLAVALAPGRRTVRIITAVILCIAAALWLLTAILGYWGHLAMLSKV